MRTIEYTRKASSNIIKLFYCTCTNDVFVNSKQASLLENFFIAFLIEFNQLFIADSLLVNKLQSHLILKTKNYFVVNKEVCANIWMDYKNAIVEHFNFNTIVEKINETLILESPNKDYYIGFNDYLPDKGILSFFSKENFNIPPLLSLRKA